LFFEKKKNFPPQNLFKYFLEALRGGNIFRRLIGYGNNKNKTLAKIFVKGLPTGSEKQERSSNLEQIFFPPFTNIFDKC